jgi:hypothetical protein
MGYGLKVLSAGGYTQINTDTTTKNTYQIKATGTTTSLAQSGGDWMTKLVSTGVSDSNALFFVRPQSRTGDPMCYAYKASSGNWGLTADGAYDWDWAVFVPATSIGNAPSTGEYGLVVYDSSGDIDPENIIFNGFDTKAMRIQNVLTGSATADPGSTGYDWYAMQQQKHQRVRPAGAITPGFVKTWVTQFNNDTNKTISQTVAETATFSAIGGTEEDPIEQVGILGDPTTLIVEI